jgi:hypothetical protein
MNSRVILNLVLLLVVAGLILVVYLQPGVEKETKPPALLSIGPEDVNRIELKPASKDAITFAKKGSEWRIVSPLDARANTFRINALLRLADTPVRKQYDVAPVDLAKFKLDKPLGVIQLNDIKITFGDSESINHYRYVMVGGKVYLTTDSYFQNLQTSLASYVDTRLLPPDSRITAIELPDMAIKAGEKGKWSVHPEQSDAMADAPQTLIDEWQEAQALRVSGYQGDTSQGTIKLTLEKRAKPLEFQVLERDPELILGRDDIKMRYHISDEQADKLMHLAVKEPKPQATQSQATQSQTTNESQPEQDDAPAK